MKKIECVIRPDKFEEVYAALRKSGIGGMSVTQIKGFGNQRAGGRDLIDKLRIDIYVDEFQVDRIIDLIIKTARTGDTGDGKIAVINLKKLYRIRTGEQGANAI
jgi:nitrogen regulatory protein P-II 1